MNDTTVRQFPVEGEMTIYTAAETKARLMPLLAQCTALEIDLSRVNEMDSAGLQLLILAKHECSRRNGALHLSGHSQAVVEVLTMCNMSDFFGAAPANSLPAH